MKTILFQFILCSFFFTAAAQDKNIALQVLSETRKPLAGINANLKLANGQSAGNALSDANGQIKFMATDTGSYFIEVSAAGFVPFATNAIHILSTQLLTELGPIILSKNIVNINAVTVSSRKKFIEIQADKTVLNIEGNINAVGNSAFELIKKAPGVTADKDENLKLKGGVAVIYIDGKPSYLSGDQLVEYLKNLQADAISKIEIIGNPGSRFDAAGSNGIINIRLRKNKAFGTNGNFTAGAGYGKYPKWNSSLSLNHRTKNLNIFSDASKGYSESFNRLNYNSIINNNGSNSYQDRNNYWNPVTNWVSYKVGADYNVGAKSTIGFLIKGTEDKTDANTSNETIFKNEALATTRSIITTKNDLDKLISHSYNLNFRKTMDSLGSELGIDADYISYNKKSEDINYNNFLDADGVDYRAPYIFRNGSPAIINIKSVKADFSKVWSSKLKMETGLKYSYVQNQNFLNVDSVNSDKNWTADNGRSNNFIYTEQISAAYLNFNRDWKKLSLQVGVRAENTSYSGNSTTLRLVNESNYLNLFPSAFATYKLDDKNTFNASYSRRINRPSYQSLNPFISYVDPFTQFEGNPNLKPSFTQSFEVKHSYRNFLYSTLSYSYTKAQTTNVILQDKITGAVRNITANVGNSSYVSLNESASVNPTKWWSMDNSVSFSAGNSSSVYPGYEFDESFFGVDVNWENSFKINKSMKAQLSAYYSSPYQDGIARVRASYSASMGLQKTILAGKGTVKINYNNFIGTSAYRAQFRSDLLNIKWVNQWEGKRVNLSFSYKFGNKNVKSARQRRSGAGDESNRVNL